MKEIKKPLSTCTMGACSKCHAGIWLIAGLILVANGIWKFSDWGTLVGIILIAAALAKFIKPCCPHCE